MSARSLLAFVFVSGCTWGNVHEAPETPSKYDTRKHRREFTITPAAEPIVYLNSLMRRANATGCSAGVFEGKAIIDCHDEVHFELTPREKLVEIACFATSMAKCVSELARIEAVPDPKAGK
ncbi:MAG: hypothetical protein ACXWUG_31610 [Polyangiales bacterium]